MILVTSGFSEPRCQSFPRIFEICNNMEASIASLDLGLDALIVMPLL
jgi:hypothetical protein